MVIDTSSLATDEAQAAPALSNHAEAALFDSPAAFRAWLSEHQDSISGLWLIMARKDSSIAALTYEEALTVALQHGWIDGQARRRDHDTFLQRFTPRRRHSPWSLRNRRRVEAMLEQGHMAPRGLAEVQRARADGRWDRAYGGTGQRNAAPHADFGAALEWSPTARSTVDGAR